MYGIQVDEPFELTYHWKMNSMTKIKQWSPCKELTAEFKEESYGVVILNSSINFNSRPDFVMRLWKQAKVKVTVDGGTEMWLQWLTSHKCNLGSVPYPDLITGDMDSTPKHILDLFLNSPTKIIITPDQNENDYLKALREIKKYCCLQNIEIKILHVLVDTCGRFDQIMANINALFKSRNILGEIKVFQIAATSLTWLLDPGKHEIEIPSTLRKNQVWCALIPVGFPCIVTTTGLKWNLENEKLEFGGLVSTSNTYDGSPEVTIQTDAPVVWSMGTETLL
ncbi:hypothetical protein JTB14_025894 [Gonioctena quinquepunctata]|nr:hypothetical protein JTB14_025894 [Gonioctena quinquepunctata]